MINGIPKISVLIICYKQEELIKRAINSLLAQKDYIYEICVSDDCSPDRTWEVLQKYDRQYPGLFKLHRNEPNVGIFENIEYTWTMPSGDIIYQLSGDDECGKDWFKTVIEYIKEHKIDYKNTNFCIYGDYKAVYPNGDYFVRTNNLASKYCNDLLSLSIRQLISPRSACFSIKILKRFIKVSKGRSYVAEDAIDKQIALFTDKSYYIPHVGNVYYARIGVCVNMSSQDHKGRLGIFKYTYDFLKKQDKLSRKNAYYLLYKDALLQCNYNKKYKNLFKVWKYKHLALVPRYDFNVAAIERIIFAIRRRLPHKKRLAMKIG